MPTVEPAIDFPSPPIDRFPEATIKRPWLKASYDLGLNAASGRMLARTVKGGIREYRFEVAFSGGVPRPTVSAGDAPNADDFGNRDGNPGFREITGLPKGSREDLLDCVRRIGAHLRDLKLSNSSNGCSNSSRPSLNPPSSLAATVGPLRKPRSCVRLTQPMAAGLSSEQRASPTTPSEQWRNGCPPTVAPESWCFVIPRTATAPVIQTPAR